MKILKIVFTFLFLTVLVGTAQADGISSQKEDVGREIAHHRNRGQPTVETCRLMWEEEWPKAKQGDLEARFNIFAGLLFPWPDSSPIAMPGSTNSFVDMIRNEAIIGVYAVDYYVSNYNKPDAALTTEDYPKLATLVIGQFRASAARDFLQCVNEKRTDCSMGAVKDKFVPSFEEYTQRIDANIKAGQYGNCEEYFKLNQGKEK